MPVKKPTKKPAKKPMKQALKLMLVTLTPSAAPPAGSTCSISNACAYLYTTSITFKAFTVNKYRKLSALPSLGLPKLSEHVKLIKVICITHIEPPVDYS